MIRDVLIRYLIDGKPVGGIAYELNIDRATVRGHLKDGGISLRPTANGYALGRDPVCDAVKRAGFPSFHIFAQVKSLDPITEQTAELCVSERSLTRVYNAYRSLLVGLKSAGITLPTPQTGDDLEYRVPGERPTG